ncbi:MAG: ABC transporter ATP-binding protein [Firmicutes bacterium]|nr:ABC transporter ATP-binding protein [Bacillota bacterium]
MKIMKRLMRYLLPYKHYLLLAILSAILSVTASLYAPIIIGHAIDCIITMGNVDFSLMSHYLAQLAFILIVSASFQKTMMLAANQMTYGSIRDLRQSAFQKFSRLPLKTIDNHSRGDLIARIIADIDIISDGLLQTFSQLFTGLVTIVVTLLFMASINRLIMLLVVVLTPLSLWLTSFIAKRNYHYFRSQSRLRGELSANIEEMVGSMKVVKAFHHEAAVQKQFEEMNQRLYDSGVKSQFFSSIANPATRFINALIYACVGISGAVLVFNGMLTTGQLSSFLAYANQYSKPFNEITGVVSELQNAFASAARVFELLDSEEEIADSSESLPLSEGHVQLDKLKFSYTNQPFIDDFSIDVKSGQHIALVGPTGCGKTTLINLLMRFYELEGGSIKIDGIDIRTVSKRSLHSQIGMVLQDTWLFSGTIRDNIAYGKPNATDEEIIAAAKAAYAHSFIKRLPQGYDTQISEGDNLSAGQKQLLCIARIMLMQPSILILDEATSNIDTRTEVKIQRAFDKIMAGKTSFVVAHRLSTIKEADCILVMKDGRVIEKGNHETLLNQHGFYASLYASQFVQS